MTILLAIQGAAAQGLLYGLMALGVYITFKVLDFADMTVDGAFACGGCVCAVLITAGVHPMISLLIAILAGMLAGLVTGLLNAVLKIPAILAGILTQIALYSINLRIMSGKSNLPLLRLPTSFTLLGDRFGMKDSTATLILGFVIVLAVIGVLYWFFGTEIGSAIRATGNNEFMVRALGGNTNTTKILALMLANSLVALSGALVTQYQKYADVTMGIGTIVIGLAAIVIGEVVFGAKRSFAYRLATVIGGTILYRIVIAVVLQLGLKSSDLKLFTAVIVAAALSVPQLLPAKKNKN